MRSIIFAVLYVILLNVPAFAESWFDNYEITGGMRYGLRDDADAEEPNEIIASAACIKNMQFKEQDLFLKPFVYFLYNSDDSVARRGELGFDLGGRWVLKGIGCSFAPRGKVTYYNYTDTVRAEMSLVLSVWKETPFSLGVVKVYPFFQDEWVNFYNKNENARNEFELGLAFPVDETWEARVSSTHIDEAYGGPDTDMVTGAIMFRK